MPCSCECLLACCPRSSGASRKRLRIPRPPTGRLPILSLSIALGVRDGAHRDDTSAAPTRQTSPPTPRRPSDCRTAPPPVSGPWVGALHDAAYGHAPSEDVVQTCKPRWCTPRGRRTLGPQRVEETGGMGMARPRASPPVLLAVGAAAAAQLVRSTTPAAPAAFPVDDDGSGPESGLSLRPAPILSANPAGPATASRPSRARPTTRPPLPRTTRARSTNSGDMTSNLTSAEASSTSVL